MRINDINFQNARPFTAVKSSRGAASDQGSVDNVTSGFADALKKAMDDLTALERDSNSKVNDLVAGKLDNVHDLMIAMEKSKLGLGLAIEVRNKLLEGYREIMRMQI